MKKLLLLILIPLNLSAQQINGTKISQVFNLEGVSAAELHNKINFAIANIFNSANDVIQLNDSQNKKFIVKAVASIPVKNAYKSMYPKVSTIPSIYNYDHPITLNIASRDGRYKITLNYGIATFLTNGTIQESTQEPLMEFADEYVTSLVEAAKLEFEQPAYKIVGKKKKQAMLDAIPKSAYAYRDALIEYGISLLKKINGEVNSASKEDDW